MKKRLFETSKEVWKKGGILLFVCENFGRSMWKFWRIKKFSF
jgi:hypothetical protein